MIVWLLLILNLLLLIASRRYTYWTRKGFPSIKPSIPVGCLGPVLAQKLSFGEHVRDIYFSSKEPFVGVYMLFRPVLLFRDPELVKRVLITDFDHFHDRGVHHDPVNDPIGANLFGMTGTKWKELRTRLTPSFSSGKLKLMFNVIQEKSHLLTDHLNHVLESTNEVHLKHPVEHLLISTIASNFFGFEFNAFENPDHEFTNMGSIFFEAEDIRSKLTFTGFFLLPELMKFFKLSMLSKQVSQFALNLVKSVVETRKNYPSTVRNDFMQTMIEMMKKDSENGTNTMSIESCTAQAFLFYTAGMDTSATTITFCIYELSKCPEWMEKVQEEVDAMMKKRNGKVLYDDLPDMKILDLCIKEALRMYPGLSVLNRLCTKEYRIPGTDHVVPEGTPVIISNLGMHMDEQFYTDPKAFDPSRFESSAKDVPYYPMGAGNRNCLGARLGLMQVKMVLCTLIYNYEFEAKDKTIKFKTGTPSLADTNGIHMKIKRRNV